MNRELTKLHTAQIMITVNIKYLKLHQSTNCSLCKSDFRKSMSISGIPLQLPFQQEDSKRYLAKMLN